MNKKTIFKGIALINFILLITVFLLYRNGSLDRYIYGNNERNLTSPNGGTPAKIPKDSTSKKMDTVEQLMLSSSKSIVLTEQRRLLTESARPRFETTKIKLRPEEKKIAPQLFLADSSKIKQNKTKKGN